MSVKIITILISILVASIGLAKDKQRNKSLVEVEIKGKDAKKIYELLNDRGTEKAAEEIGEFYHSKFGKGVQCRQNRGKENADDKNYECIFQVNTNGIVLEQIPRF